MLKPKTTQAIKGTLLVTLLIGYLLPCFADGLPGEQYVTQRWRDILSGHSPTLNPAFMTEENYSALRLAICPTLQNSFILMEFGAVVPIGLFQTAGISYIGFSPNNDLKKSYFNYNDNEIVVTDESLNDNQHQFILSYAVNPWNRMSFGTNLNLMHNANYYSSFTRLGLDLAVSYRVIRHEILGDHVIGINFQNILSPDFSFKRWTNDAANLKLSWIGKILENRIDVGIDLDIKDFMSQAADFAQTAVSGGSPKKAEVDFNSRIGFWIFNIINVYLQAGSNYWGITPGLNVPTINFGRDFQIAYQYMSIVDGLDLTATHTFYFRGDFGKHREEIYARKMARMANLAPTDLYNKGRTLFSQGKYWDAFFLFSKILMEYPNFFKNDWVHLHLGLCQEALDMKEYATENLLKTKQAFPRSEVVFYADLGLLRMHYRDNNTMGVANQFARLNLPSVPDSIKFCAYYFMGLQHMRNNDNRKAVQLFELVPATHPEYVFARFSSGIAYAAINDMNSAIAAFHKVSQAVPATRAQAEIINKSLTLVGYIYFEGIKNVEPSLSQAVAVLRKVPLTSYYYEDAQLGLAWAALKAGIWEDCIKACDEIIRASRKTVLQSEAMLLKAYCYMITNRYQEAVDILSPAYELVSRAKTPSLAEKETATQEFYNNRDTYYSIATMMDELAFTGQSVYITKQIDSLHAPQMALEKKLRDYYTYSDEFGRLSFFSKNLESLRNDIEYALAKASKMAGMGRTIKIKENAGEKIDKIEDEIKKYQEELDKLKQNNNEE